MIAKVVKIENGRDVLISENNIYLKFEINAYHHRYQKLRVTTFTNDRQDSGRDFPISENNVSLTLGKKGCHNRGRTLTVNALANDRQDC